MCESIENLIELTNKSIKSESENIQECIKEISNVKYLENYENINKLEDSSDDLNQSLKIIKRLKLLRNKFKRIKSEINELTMYAYKPERIDTDDEEEWEEEENQIIKSKIISSLKHKLDGKLECEYESESDSEFGSESDSESENDKENDTKPTIETPIKFNRKSKSI